MSVSEPEVDVLVVGAGLSGLMAARRLTDAGRRVVVVEAEDSAGGRAVTRAIGSGQADSGAQFFTIREARFNRIVGRWLATDIVFEWSWGWSDGSLLSSPPDGYPRYAVRGGFGALARYLAGGLDVRTATRLTLISHQAGRWLVKADSGASWRSRAVVLTPPVPQSLALLKTGGLELPAAERLVLKDIEYAPCLCGLFDIEGEINLPLPGALQRPGHPISWVADNQRKGISPEGRVITVHANREASMQRWSADDETVLTWMLGEIAPWLAAGARARESRLERWRYAVPLDVYPERYLMCRLPAPLVFAGDAFDGPRIEGAALSGLAAAEALLEKL
jgi:predicted NAD/FAD-dependent oxidoreductase